MSLIRRNNGFGVFSDLWNGIESDLAKAVGYDIEATVPAVNVVETEKGFRLDFAAPGLQKQDFNITLDKDILTVYVQKEKSEEKAPEKYIRKEFAYHSFERSFKLPELSDKDAISAMYDQGVLKIEVPKKNQEKEVKTINIS